jgi:hypothetical protein
MKKLIEVHAFANCPVFSCGGNPNDPYYAGYCDALDRVVEWMENFPAVDAVPVVRCKDCKRFVEGKEAFVTYCSKGCGIAYVKPDDFCSHAERRADG